jgi:predicted dehydrogenase
MGKSARQTRRAFLRQTALTASGAMVVPTLVPRTCLASAAVPGANDRAGIGYIGVGRRAGQLQGLPSNAQVVGTADCNIARAKAWGKKYSCPSYQDYRELLESDAVDGVIAASTDHWHALHSIHACQAGKDVYTEKPINLTVRESQAMVKAVRKHNRIFQAGSQQRTDTYCQVGCAEVLGGAIGKIKTIMMRNLESPWICRLPEQACPKEINWDMWCGQVEPLPYNKDLYQPRANPGWLSFRRFSGGEMTGWGAHSFDIIQWALGADGSGPVEIWIDDEPKYEELVFTESKSRAWGYETCTKPRVHMKYACGAEVILEEGPDFGGIFIGENGKIEINRGKFVSNPPELAKQALADQEIHTGTDIHIKNWVDCMISREEPNAPIEIAHGSTVACHLGNIARWLSRPARWDPKSETFPGDNEANALLEREMRKPYAIPETL